MSYNVEVVAIPVPDDDTAAWAFLDGLFKRYHEEACIQPDVFVRLHKRLTERYPCMCDDDGAPWADGPLIDNFGSELAVLGVVSSEAAAVVPFVIESATAMGLTVFDSQEGTIHRALMVGLAAQ